MSDWPEGQPRPVLVDTNVFSRAFVPEHRSNDGDAWFALLSGRTIVLAVQTEVELKAWPKLKHWGDARTQRLLSAVDALGRIEVGLTVRDAYVDLTVWGHEHGHAIGQPVHVADRWIAASAIAWGLVLATTDGIFDGIDGLQLMNLPEPN